MSRRVKCRPSGSRRNTDMAVRALREYEEAQRRRAIQRGGTMTTITRDEAAAEIDRLVEAWNATSWDERCISCEARAEQVEPDAPTDMPPVVRAWAYGIQRKGALIQNTFEHRDDCRFRNALSEATSLASDWGFELELGRVIHKVKGSRVTYLMIVRRKPD